MARRDDEDDTEREEKPSREALRRRAAEYSALAEQLAKGKPAELPNPPFDAELHDAVVDSRRLVKSARTRQIRRVASLLRVAGPIDEIRAALEGSTAEIRSQRSREASNERWRARLLEGGDPVLTEFVSEFPLADRKRLRQLMRQGRRTPPDARSKKAATNLLREIRKLTDAAASANAASLTETRPD